MGDNYNYWKFNPYYYVDWNHSNSTTDWTWNTPVPHQPVTVQVTQTVPAEALAPKKDKADPFQWLRDRVDEIVAFGEPAFV